MSQCTDKTSACDLKTNVDSENNYLGVIWSDRWSGGGYGLCEKCVEAQPAGTSGGQVLHKKDLMRSTLDDLMWQAILRGEWEDHQERQIARNEYTALGLGNWRDANRLLPEPSRLSEEGSLFDVHSYVSFDF